MRLNKFIAHYSTFSRREADRSIQGGYVKVNGELETNPARDVNENRDVVFIAGKRVSPKNKFTVIVYNKPKGELVTKKDPQNRPTIYDSLPKEFKHFKPVGRLDFASEGLLLLTDSSVIATALMESDLQRIYKIKIRGDITPQMETAMLEGITLDDATKGAHKKTKIKSMTFKPFLGYNIIKNQPNYSIVKVAISEGKNRELRRFFAAFDREVLDLKRLEFAEIKLNSLPTGKTRYLDKKEYAALHKFLKDSNAKTNISNKS